MHYPHAPGHKSSGTSAESARRMSETAPTLRQDVLDLLATESLTADEAAAKLGKSILSIRPRLSELRTAGQIADSGERRKNASGHRAVVWRAL